jgi:hypothetical protein
MDAEAFRSMTAVLSFFQNTIEGDGSSLFCEVVVA